MPKITSVIIAAVIISILMVFPPNITALEPGENESIEVKNTPISAITHEDTSFDGVDFEISIELVQNASQNGTVVEIWTQICINSGICYDPVWHCEEVDGGRCTKQLTKSEGNSTWIGVVVPDITHTYVNYKVNLVYPDDSEEMFSSGKVWSNCWTFGNSSGGECSGVQDSVPTVGLVSVITVALIAAILRKH